VCLTRQDIKTPKIREKERICTSYNLYLIEHDSMQVMIDDGFVANVASTVCILEGIQRFLQIDFCRAVQ
jgi:hypothetical protein